MSHMWAFYLVGTRNVLVFRQTVQQTTNAGKETQNSQHYGLYIVISVVINKASSENNGIFAVVG